MRYGAFFVFLLFTFGQLQSGEFFYAFRTEDQGGCARVQVDDVTGKILSHQAIVESPEIKDPQKLANLTSPHTVALADYDKTGQVVLVDLSSGESTFIATEFGEVDEVCPVPNGFVIGGEEGNVVFISAREGAITARWNAKKSLNPPGHKSEDIQLSPCGEFVLITFQKDSKNGKNLGHRLVILKLPHLDLISDLQLPRDQEDLHISNNAKESGPSPEKVVVFPDQDTLCLTYDLYGALAFASWQGALAGELKDYQTISTAADQNWGTAFPDRVASFMANGKNFLWISNAAENAGTVVASIADRKIHQVIPSAAGLETPALLENGLVLASIQSGKEKSRGASGLEKTYSPQSLLHVFRVQQVGDAVLSHEVHPLPGRPLRLARASKRDGSFIGAIVSMNDAEQLVIVDTRDGRILDQQAALGKVGRMVSAP